MNPRRSREIRLGRALAEHIWRMPRPAWRDAEGCVRYTLARAYYMDLRPNHGPLPEVVAAFCALADTYPGLDAAQGEWARFRETCRGLDNRHAGTVVMWSALTDAAIERLHALEAGLAKRDRVRDQTTNG